MATPEGFSQLSTCVNHPERIAVENCEVCNSPLCAYCLYYTSDGQRLCRTHAEQAQAAGAFIRAPGVYAEGLVPAQVDAAKQSEEPVSSKPAYQGNSMDLVALMGLVLGVVSLASCFGGICLLLPLGFVASLVSLLSLKDAFDKARTRRLAIFGMAITGLGALAIAGCIAFYFASFGALISSSGPPRGIVTTIQFGATFQVITLPSGFRTDTPTPRATRTPDPRRSATPTKTATPEFTDTPNSFLRIAGP